MEAGSGAWSLVADSGPEEGQVITVINRVEIGRVLEWDISMLERAFCESMWNFNSMVNS